MEIDKEPHRMSSPRLGVVRKSMMTRPLLIKAPLGSSRPVPGLPGPGFTYGASSSHGEGGVAEVLSSWKVQTRPEDSPRCPDFVSLNREAMKSGVVTSKELSQYRAQRGVASSPRTSAHKRREGGASRRAVPVPDITFGVRNRPPSPFADVLSNQYAQRWFDEQLKRNQTSNQKEKVKAGCAAETRTSLLRRSKPLPTTQRPSILNQYTQVGPALDTFRDQEVQLQASRVHSSGSASATGDQDPGPNDLD